MEHNRREFLKMAAGAAATGLAGPVVAARQQKAGKAQTVLPRWRGFNLQEMFTMRSRGDWREDDFKWMRDMGFDFV
ncbi:MAG: twin-arginine translocation signal domain-containing protein, partial [Phycisphaerales bacterium]